MFRGAEKEFSCLKRFRRCFLFWLWSLRALRQARRPMTFEDMMAMKRLGETAVSPDGRWLVYSVTTVELNQNTKTAELWVQAIAGGEAAEARRGRGRR